MCIRDRWYVEHLEKLNEGVILDLGSGIIPDLEFYEKILSKNDRIMFICLEPFKLAIKIADEKIRIRKGIAQVCGFGEDAPFRKKVFDVVFMRSSYAHFFDLERVLKNIHRTLKNDGRLVIFEEHAPLVDKSELWVKHYRDHTLKEAISEIERHGFEVIDTLKKRESWGILAVKD